MVFTLHSHSHNNNQRGSCFFFLHRVFDFFLFHVNTNKYHQLHHLLLTILLFVDYCGQLSNVMYLKLAALLLELHSAPLKLSLFD